MKGRKANTFYDNRFTEANKINNKRESCPRGSIIVAEQKDNRVTAKCNCGVTITMTVGGIINASDVLSDFHDTHLEQIRL